MTQKKINIHFTVLAVFIFIAAFSRIIPHVPNFSPLGAVGLFSAAHFAKKWQALLIPILAVWISDLFINNVIYAQYYPGFTWFYSGFYWQYGSYLLITCTGLLIFKKVTVFRVLTGALTSTVIFFLISNFGCWPGNSYYTQDINGLMACYAAGLPYLKGTLSGDLFYCIVLFGSFALAQRRFPELRVKHTHMVPLFNKK